MKNTQVQTNKTKQTRQLKLTTVTRNDLSPGYQLVQASHSNIQFLIEHPQISKEWYKNPYLAALSTKDENSLKNIIKKAEEKGIKYSVFREPDIDNQITAITLEPSDKTRRLTSSLPLALKEFNFLGMDKNTTKKKEECYV